MNRKGYNQDDINDRIAIAGRLIKEGAAVEEMDDPDGCVCWVCAQKSKEGSLVNGDTMVCKTHMGRIIRKIKIDRLSIYVA
jgi:formylmethanofuran dehydrogenase subunit D